MTTLRSVLLQLESLKRIKDAKKRRKGIRDKQAFMEHIKTCVTCRIKWEAEHGGISKERILELTGKTIPVNDTGVVAPKLAKHLLN